MIERQINILIVVLVIIIMLFGVSPFISNAEREGQYVELTAYTLHETYHNGGIMANGEYVHYGAIACNWLPFGTLVRIPELRKEPFIVKDRGGMDGIDIYMDSYDDAIMFGRRVMLVYIYD